jgi:hypothetical protein
MLLKALLALTVLLSSASPMEVSVGAYNATQRTWRGYNPICDNQCLSNNGTICGSNVRESCAPGFCAP